jgi:putative ABC transport system substrate-binding protein
MSAIFGKQGPGSASRLPRSKCGAVKTSILLSRRSKAARRRYVPATPIAFVNRIRISTLALATHVPTMLGVREYVEAGGLMSYGPNWPHMWRRAADLVDKILRGTKPSDIPVEQPTEFDLVINLTTAKALGLTIPDKLLALANAVIE